MRSGTPRRVGVLVSAIAGLLVITREAQGITIHVPAGGNLQAAIDQAQGGDVITLQAGAVYSGNFWLRNKPGVTVPIVIRTATPDTSLPGPGVRMTPAYAPLLAKIRSSNTMPAVRTAVGAHHWTLQFLEFQANLNGYSDIIALGANDTTQTDLTTVPYALVLDRLYIHGDPLVGQKRGIALHSRDTTIINSYISDCKGVGQDTQAIFGGNGPGNYLIENNYLEGAGENFMIGGVDPTIPNLVPTNIVFRRNHVYKPVEWRNPIVPTPQNVTATPVAGGGTLPAGTYSYRVVARRLAGQTNQAYSAPSGEVAVAVGASGAARVSWQPVPNAQDYLIYGRTAGATNVFWTTTGTVFTDTGAAGTAGTPGSGTRWVAKNLFELKSGQDIVVEGNVFENNWVGDQSGYAIALTPRNQSGGAPWTVLQRVSFRYNLVRHTAGGVNILGTDNIHPSLRTNNITLEHNLWEDLTPTWGAGSRFLIIGAGPDAVTVNHNTILTTQGSIVWLYGGSAGSPTPITNSRYTNNMSAHRTYGIMGQDYAAGQASISAYMPNGVVTGNVLAGGPASSYPAGNFFPTTAVWESGFVNYAAGDYRLAASSPYRNAGTDGTDLGANIGAIAAHTTIALGGSNSTVPCSYTVSPTTQSIAASGGNATVTVSTTSGCGWTAAANQSWVSVTSGASGNGNGTLAYTVAPNTTTASRTATLTVAGRAVTLTQAAGCSYTVSPTTVAVPGSGGSATVAITTTAGCSWTAASAATWISVSSASGSGSGSLTLTIAASSQSTARSSTATVAGRTVTVTQGGVMRAPTLSIVPLGN